MNDFIIKTLLLFNCLNIIYYDCSYVYYYELSFFTFLIFNVIFIIYKIFYNYQKFNIYIFYQIKYLTIIEI